uniref:Uncharacterized protein n=1 Tax=Leersia perrieri TaxID=77586 RepID=A0A0D9V9R3_9ORYZ
MLFTRRFQNLHTEQIEELPATLLYTDSHQDIAILRVEGLTEQVPALTFSPMAAASIGDTAAIALGYCNPQGLFPGGEEYPQGNSFHPAVVVLPEVFCENTGLV